MIQKLDKSILSDYSVAYAIQKQVADAINQCDALVEAGYVAIPENTRDIDFQIQNNLKKQGMAIIVMTPKLKYQGQDQDGNVYFDFPELVIQCTEYVNINRAGNKEKFATALDIATFLQTWLGSLSEPVITFGQLCPDEVEQGEDNGLLVCTSKFKTFAGQKKPDNEWFVERKKFGLKIDNVLPNVVDGVFSFPETPKSNFIVPGLSAIAAFEMFSRFMRNKNVQNVSFPDLKTVGMQGFERFGFNSNIQSFDAPQLSSIGNASFRNTFYSAGIKTFNAPNILSAPPSSFYQTFVSSDIEELNFPNLTAVGADSFSYCASYAKNLRSVNLSALTNVPQTIPVVTYFNNAFANCPNLTSVNLENLEYVGQYAFNYAFANCPNLKCGIKLNKIKSIYTSGFFSAFANAPISALELDLDNCTYMTNDAFASMTGNFCYVQKSVIKNIRKVSNNAFNGFCGGSQGNRALKWLEITFSEKNLSSTERSSNSAFPTNAFANNWFTTLDKILLDYRYSNFAYTSTLNTQGLGRLFNNVKYPKPEIYFPEEWYCHGSDTNANYGLIYSANMFTSTAQIDEICIQNMKTIDHQWQTVLSPVAYMCNNSKISAFNMPDLEEVIMNNGLTGSEKQYFGLINHTFDNCTTIKNISFPELRTLEGRIFHRANEFHANVRNLVVDLPKLETYIGDDYCLYSGPGYVDRINLHSLQLINNPIINITSNVGNNTQIYLNSDFLTINSDIISNTTNKPITFYFSENNRAYIESHELYATKFGGGSNCTIEFI